MHLKALEAETLDQVTAKTLAKSLVKAAATRADRADALHALLHAGVDAALADAPSTLILLGALRPYVDAAQPKRRGKDAEADAKAAPPLPPPPYLWLLPPHTLSELPDAPETSMCPSNTMRPPTRSAIAAPPLPAWDESP